MKSLYVVLIVSFIYIKFSLCLVRCIYFTRVYTSVDCKNTFACGDDKSDSMCLIHAVKRGNMCDPWTNVGRDTGHGVQGAKVWKVKTILKIGKGNFEADRRNLKKNMLFVTVSNVSVKPYSDLTVKANESSTTLPTSTGTVAQVIPTNKGFLMVKDTYGRKVYFFTLTNHSYIGHREFKGTDDQITVIECHLTDLWWLTETGVLYIQPINGKPRKNVHYKNGPFGFMKIHGTQIVLASKTKIFMASYGLDKMTEQANVTNLLHLSFGSNGESVFYTQHLNGYMYLYQINIERKYKKRMEFRKPPKDTCFIKLIDVQAKMMFACSPYPQMMTVHGRKKRNKILSKVQDTCHDISTDGKNLFILTEKREILAVNPKGLLERISLPQQPHDMQSIKLQVQAGISSKEHKPKFESKSQRPSPNSVFVFNNYGGKAYLYHGVDPDPIVMKRPKGDIPIMDIVYAQRQNEMKWITYKYLMSCPFMKSCDTRLSAPEELFLRAKYDIVSDQYFYMTKFHIFRYTRKSHSELTKVSQPFALELGYSKRKVFWSEYHDPWSMVKSISYHGGLVTTYTKMKASLFGFGINLLVNRLYICYSRPILYHIDEKKITYLSAKYRHCKDVELAADGKGLYILSGSRYFSYYNSRGERLKRWILPDHVSKSSIQVVMNVEKGGKK